MLVSEQYIDTNLKFSASLQLRTSFF